jgi:DNA-binding beta-propeller fold protein YncE
LIADTWNNRVRRVAPDGTITTAAGSGVHRGDQLEGLGDGGPAAAASLDGPSGVATMPDGGFVIADTGNHRIRRVSPNGTISTVAGTDQDFSGDGGLATKGRLASPRGVAVGPGGDVLIADSLNDRVRRVGRDGRISTVAGRLRDQTPVR